MCRWPCSAGAALDTSSGHLRDRQDVLTGEQPIGRFPFSGASPCPRTVFESGSEREETRLSAKSHWGFEPVLHASSPGSQHHRGAHLGHRLLQGAPADVTGRIARESRTSLVWADAL